MLNLKSGETYTKTSFFKNILFKTSNIFIIIYFIANPDF